MIPPNSQTIALIRPLSALANQAIRQTLKKYSLAKSVSQTDLVVEVDFKTLAGRGQFCFGSSPDCNVFIPEEHGVSPYHCKLHFEMHTGCLLLTDGSTSQTWVMDDVLNPDGLALHKATQPLSRKTTIMVGTRDDLCFSITIVDQPRRYFEASFSQYAASLGVQEPTVILGTPTTTSRYLSPERTFISVDDFDSGGFGTISACISSSDGALYAAKCCKKQSHLLYLRNEINILKTLRHVSSCEHTVR